MKVWGGTQMSFVAGNGFRLGKSVSLQGEIEGQEDLVFDGHLTGDIHLEGHHLVIGATAHVEGNVYAKSVTLLGQVVGEIHAEEVVSIRSTGTLEGNIHSPRIAIAMGAYFKGQVEMKEQVQMDVREDRLAMQLGFSKSAG